MRLALAGGDRFAGYKRDPEVSPGKQLDTRTLRWDRTIEDCYWDKDNKTNAKSRIAGNNVREKLFSRHWSSQSRMKISKRMSPFGFPLQLIILSAVVLFSCHTDRWLHSPGEKLWQNERAELRGKLLTALSVLFARIMAKQDY